MRPFRQFVLPLALVSLGACTPGGDAAKERASSSETGLVPTSPPSPSTAAPAPPPPDDLSVAPIQKALKCANDAKSGACGILARFASCTPWGVDMPSSEGRWLGRGTSVDGKKSSDVFVMLRARRVPSQEVGAGQIPAKIAINELDKDDKQAFEAADRAIRILERHDVSSRFNAALDYVNKRQNWTESFATRTAGGQVYLLTKGGAFACLGPKKELLVVERAAKRGADADGLYAELWATTW